MANLVQLGQQFILSKQTSQATQEGKELGRLKGEFKHAFTNYLNWGGKYEVHMIEEKNLDNKAERKVNEWALQHQRIEASASIPSRISQVVTNFFRKIVGLFYKKPEFPAAQERAYQQFYAQVHQSEEPGARLVQATRTAKHAFKDAYVAADAQTKAQFHRIAKDMTRKADYWDWKRA